MRAPFIRSIEIGGGEVAANLNVYMTVDMQV